MNKRVCACNDLKLKPLLMQSMQRFQKRTKIAPPPPGPPPVALRKCRPCTDMYHHALPCTLLDFDLYCLVPFRVLPCTFLYCPVPLCTQLSTVVYVLLDIFLYQYVPVCTDLYRYATFLK